MDVKGGLPASANGTRDGGGGGGGSHTKCRHPPSACTPAPPPPPSPHDTRPHSPPASNTAPCDGTTDEPGRTCTSSTTLVIPELAITTGCVGTRLPLCMPSVASSGSATTSTSPHTTQRQSQKTHTKGMRQRWTASHTHCSDSLEHWREPHCMTTCSPLHASRRLGPRNYSGAAE